MKYVITPTFIGHLCYIPKYIQSFVKYVEDKENVTICFIIEEKDIPQLMRITDQFKGTCNIQIYNFDEILLYFGITYSSDELLKKYGRFTYQTFKKFLGISIIKAKVALILDSESMWVNPTNMTEMEKNYMKDPFLTVSSIINDNQSAFFLKVVNNTDYLLSTKSTVWTLENFVWYMEQRIVNDLFTKHGSLLQMADCIYERELEDKEKAGIMEALLYQEYVFHNKEKYNYRIIEIDKELKKELGPKEYNLYLEQLYKKCGGNVGFAEHAMELLTNDNIVPIANVFRKCNQNIIRCECAQSLRKRMLQEPFMKIVKPNIFAASQEHYWGLNSSIKTIVNTELRKVL